VVDTFTVWGRAAALAGPKSSGGHFNACRKNLRESGYIAIFAAPLHEDFRGAQTRRGRRNLHAPSRLPWFPSASPFNEIMRRVIRVARNILACANANQAFQSGHETQTHRAFDPCQADRTSQAEAGSSRPQAATSGGAMGSLGCICPFPGSQRSPRNDPTASCQDWPTSGYRDALMRPAPGAVARRSCNHTHQASRPRHAAMAQEPTHLPFRSGEFVRAHR
jgi:hypothetical protein